MVVERIGPEVRKLVKESVRGHANATIAHLWLGWPADIWSLPDDFPQVRWEDGGREWCEAHCKEGAVTHLPQVVDD